MTKNIMTENILLVYLVMKRTRYNYGTMVVYLD